MENDVLYNTISEMVTRGMDLQAILNELLEGGNGTEQSEMAIAIVQNHRKVMNDRNKSKVVE